MNEINTLNCIIIDDEPLALDLMESYVNKTSFLNLLGKYQSAIQAMREMNLNDVDLIFVDIQMPELNGLDFAKNINPRCKIVFTTAFQQYAFDSYKVDALDYLLKPISYGDFLKSAEKALRWFNLTHTTKNQEVVESTNENEVIYIKSDHKIVQLKFTDIIYIECIKDYVKIFVEGAEFPIVSLITMKNIEEKLPSDQFMRVHRSFIVRKDRIKLIYRNNIIFGNTQIPISLSHRNEVKRYVDLK